MHFAVLPPEVNSGRMYAGPGAGSMLAAAAAWDELADELHTTAADVESVISGLTSEPWEGAASESMAAAAVPQVSWLSSTAAQATQASAQAKAAAAAYESAYAMTVPPPEISANRAHLTSLIATNLLGQNTPAIAANEVAYGEMWAQDVAAMYSYAGDSQAASQVTPFNPPEQTTNEGGLGAQSAATAQAAGTSAGNAQTTLTSAGSMMSAVPNALQTLTSSSSGLSAFSDFSNPFDLASLGSSLLGNGVGLIGLSGAAGFITDAEHKADGVDAAPGPRPTEPEAPTPRLPGKATTASAGLGRASSLGGLSVPEGWATAAPQVRLVGLASPNTSPVPVNGSSPGPFSGMPIFGGAPLMALPGRGTSDSRDRRAGDKSEASGFQMRAGAAPYDRVDSSPSASGGRATGAAAELREITELLSKLAHLRDSGVLTDTEFSQQKQRLLGSQ
jgi:PPE-repeat protein